jgi:TatD DNase family protein
MFIDSHAHIDGPEFDADRDEVIQRARDGGIAAILNVGTGDPHSGAFERAVEIAEKYADIYTAIGVHPHDARLFDDATEQLITNLLTQSSRIIAWGEIGLDFHYDNSPRDVQMTVFRRQLQLARQANLPVVIHTREADSDTIDILKSEWTGSGRPAIMHCFSGSLWLAQQAIESGFYISFSGIVTFKKAEELRAIAAQVPLHQLLIETDCPFLAPVPFRGKRNEPAFVVEVARSLAGIQGKTVEEIGQITSGNFARLFNLTAANF